MSADLLEPQVRRLFSSLTHAGDGKSDSDEEHAGEWRLVEGEAGHREHGTRVRFILRLRGSQLVGARYYAYGCPHTLAVCEWLAERLEAGEMAALGAPADWCASLGVPIVKLGRLLVVEDALRSALGKAVLVATETAKTL
ncbi:MAG TPA: hypothetical protein VNZ06_06490 [Steroidobacteraceae bacterium]|jgi:hypothetical protein|nr:hypothetical protein [Steroidobacteraceae bacterium]